MPTLKLQLQGGLNNKSKSQTMQPPFVKDAVNVDYADDGEIRKRPGCEKIYSGINCHSFFFVDSATAYFVEDGVLKEFDLNNRVATALKSGMGDYPVSYCLHEGTVFFSNGVFSGCVYNHTAYSWGVPRPPRNPEMAAIPVGGLYAGIYQIAITWYRNGIESGAHIGNNITVAEGGGIALSNFPEPPAEVDAIGVYVSSNNGKDFYLYNRFAGSTQSVMIGRKDSNITLKTQFFREAPAFSFIESHAGRVYGAFENYVFFTKAMNPHLFAPNDYFTFPDTVKLIVSIGGVLYIVTTAKTYLVSNLDADSFPVLIDVLPFGTHCNAVAKDSVEKAAYWGSERGFVKATSEGAFPIAEDRIVFGQYSVGAMCVLVTDGVKKLVSSFKQMIFLD